MGSKILINSEMLSQPHIPKKLVHREKEFTQLSNAIGLVNTFVHGSIGSGRTLLLKHIIENYNTTKKARGSYIDCSLYQTTNAILHEILTALNSVVVSKSNYKLTKRLKTRIMRLGFPLVICLDHFDHLKEVEAINRILS